MYAYTASKLQTTNTTYPHQNRSHKYATTEIKIKNKK